MSDAQVEMDAVAAWSEGTRAAFMRTGLAGVAALLLILIFAIYVRFFPTPLSSLIENYAPATMEQAATGTSRKIAPSNREESQ